MPTSLFALSYTASFQGVDNPKVLAAIKQASFFSQKEFQDTNIQSLKQLKKIIDEECGRIKKIAIYHGFLLPSVTGELLNPKEGTILFSINLGTRFAVNSLTIRQKDVTPSEQSLKKNLQACIEDIPSYKKNQYVDGLLLEKYKKELLDSLSSRGFFQPKIISLQSIATTEKRTVDVEIEVETGILSYFGPVQIEGLKSIQPAYILSNATWERGDLYNHKKILQFESDLMKTGLFQLISIESRRSPINPSIIVTDITVVEGRHKTAGTGISYTSTLGAGASVQFEHRNVHNVGQRFSFRADGWQKMQKMTATYTFPHWGIWGAKTSAILEYDHQTYLPYHSISWKASLLREKRLSKHLEIIWGPRFEYSEATKLIEKERYQLIKLPVSFKWSSINSMWDPISGTSINLKMTPSYQYIHPNFPYMTLSGTASKYLSFYDDKMTLAGRVSLGSILINQRHHVPLPDRFFGGTENSLRGYKTGSVSPLNAKGDPIGGKSIFTGTVELRHRYDNGFGSVLFYDVGNVYRNSLPNLRKISLLQSVGYGIRYETPIGPIRLDIAFPLHRRKSIDPLFQIYFSVGQSF